MVSNKLVSGIAFTGSRTVGLKMVESSASSGSQKIFVVEMGGKNPCIVSKNADIEKAVKGSVSAAFGFSGQKCSALSRLYVHESIKEKFISRLIEKTRALKVGSPIEKENYIGPLISENAYKMYVYAVEKA
ncbi:Aldehyde dehydrogenase domain protein, partial [mine drainage metagenome]